tara:strand:+ start:27865 stop:29049 length:1185 start_codon:yes stop_codon:yes gene_type:complete
VSDIALFAANILVGFTLSLCVLIVAIGRDRQLLVWSLIFGLHAASYGLLALRGQIPDFISIVVANTFVSAMLALYVEGICRFESVRPRRWPYWLPVFATFVSYWVFIEDFDTRVALGSVLYASQTAYLFYIVVRVFRQREGQGRWIMMGAASIATAMLVFRVVIALLADPEVVSGSGTSLLPMMTSLSAISVLIMFAFGLIVVFKERAEQANLELALLDPLTSLGNRRMLENTLKLALRNSVRTKQIGAILLIDLDEFKPLNDSYGHGIGDQLLVEVSYRLKECVKNDDTVVRMGGDEFVVSLNDLGTEPRLARDNALLVAERILSEISRPYQCLTFALDGEQRQRIQHECTCSIGIAFFVSNEVSEEKLLTNADLAMYKAKEQGRNRIVVHQD